MIFFSLSLSRFLEKDLLLNFFYTEHPNSVNEFSFFQITNTPISWDHFYL